MAFGYHETVEKYHYDEHPTEALGATETGFEGKYYFAEFRKQTLEIAEKGRFAVTAMAK